MATGTVVWPLDEIVLILIESISGLAWIEVKKTKVFTFFTSKDNVAWTARKHWRLNDPIYISETLLDNSYRTRPHTNE